MFRIQPLWSYHKIKKETTYMDPTAVGWGVVMMDILVVVVVLWDEFMWFLLVCRAITRTRGAFSVSPRVSQSGPRLDVWWHLFLLWWWCGRVCVSRCFPVNSNTHLYCFCTSLFWISLLGVSRSREGLGCLKTLRVLLVRIIGAS